MSFHNSQQPSLWEGVPVFSSYIHKDTNRLSGVTKYRRIYVPNEPMREVQEQVKAAIRKARMPLPFATAIMPGSSQLANVQQHRYGRYFYLLDLEKAYQFVDAEQLDQVLANIGVEERIRRLVSLYCLLPEGGLYTGGLASPDLFNIYAGALIDRPIQQAMDSYNWDTTYTRYLDDLTFSSPWPIGRRRRRHILSIIRSAGFTHSRGKAQVVDLRAQKHMTINGVGLEYGGRIFVPRPFMRQLFVLLKKANAGEPVSQEVIGGQMGVFWSATSRYATERKGIERRIIREFRKYQARNKPRRQRRVFHGTNGWRSTALARADRRRRRGQSYSSSPYDWKPAKT